MTASRIGQPPGGNVSAVTDVSQPRLSDPRLWLVGAVLGAGAAAWVAVAIASTHYLEYSSYLGVVGIALALGSSEAAYLASKTWRNGQRASAGAAASGATVGPLLILAAILGGVTFSGFVLIASGVGLLGFSCAIGLYGMFKGKVATPAVRLTGFIIIAGLAYFAQLLWAQVP